MIALRVRNPAARHEEAFKSAGPWSQGSWHPGYNLSPVPVATSIIEANSRQRRRWRTIRVFENDSAERMNAMDWQTRACRKIWFGTIQRPSTDG
jgi:hypothetical protein